MENSLYFCSGDGKIVLAKRTREKIIVDAIEPGVHASLSSIADLPERDQEEMLSGRHVIEVDLYQSNN